MYVGSVRFVGYACMYVCNKSMQACMVCYGCVLINVCNYDMHSYYDMRTCLDVSAYVGVYVLSICNVMYEGTACMHVCYAMLRHARLRYVSTVT